MAKAIFLIVRISKAEKKQFKKAAKKNGSTMTKLLKGFIRFYLSKN